MIKIRNWDKWQTYRSDRGKPPWIKIHRCIRSNPEWAQLTDKEKGQLVCLWILAAEKDGIIPCDDPVLIQKMSGVDEPPDLKRFESLEFLDVKVTPRRRHNDATVTPAGQPSDAPVKLREDKRREDKSMSAGYPADVLAIWDITPEKGRRRSSKKQLADAWKALRPKPAIDDVIDGLERFKLTEEWMKDGGQYIPGIHVWVKNRKWEVETKPAKQPRRKDSPEDIAEARAMRRRMAEGGFK